MSKGLFDILLDQIFDVDLLGRRGDKLILRTAKKGANAGNQFYGCSNFPQCRYVQNK